MNDIIHAVLRLNTLHKLANVKLPKLLLHRDYQHAFRRYMESQMMARICKCEREEFERGDYDVQMFGMQIKFI